MPKQKWKAYCFAVSGKRSIRTSGIANQDAQIILLAGLVYKKLLYEIYRPIIFLDDHLRQTKS